MQLSNLHFGHGLFDLQRSFYVGQINKAQNANLKIEIINAGLFLYCDDQMQLLI